MQSSSHTFLLYSIKNGKSAAFMASFFLEVKNDDPYEISFAQKSTVSSTCPERSVASPRLQWQEVSET